ncbi:hypothetical protein [Crossiella sp. NPDC003009]
MPGHDLGAVLRPGLGAVVGGPRSRRERPAKPALTRASITAVAVRVLLAEGGVLADWAALSTAIQNAEPETPAGLELCFPADAAHGLVEQMAWGSR